MSLLTSPEIDRQLSGFLALLSLLLLQVSLLLQGPTS
jgi:hypothetical protein